MRGLDVFHRGARCLVVVLAANLMLGGCVWQLTQFWIAGDQVALRETDADERPPTEDHPTLLILAIDGIDRHLLYAMLREGELPQLARMLGGDGQGFPHAYFDEDMESVVPSSTGVSWATMMTGVNPAVHGVTGNEYFVRDTGRFAAPVPVTIGEVLPVLKIYTDGYANKLLAAPTVYQRMRTVDPGVRVWVGMHQYYAGADRLILTDRTSMLEAFQYVFQANVTDPLLGRTPLSLFHELDQEVVENMDELMESEPPADVITLYMPGLDHYAHVTDGAPDATRATYLKKAIEPMMKSLRATLDERHALDDRYVVLVADHGHTGVIHDDAHSLGIDGQGEPREVLENAGFRVRPFSLEVDDETVFDTVLAYQGAMAYVYVADRSTCPKATDRTCDWRQPARAQDIDAVAEAYSRNNENGDLVPAMQGVLDMILVRTGASDTGSGDVFQVYLGDGEHEPIAAYLADHPHPRYVELAQRIRDLTRGPHGDNVGDVILIAHNGDVEDPAQRYYFASLYYSWHGSPSARDSDIPLIVANRAKRADEIERIVHSALDGGYEERRIADVLLRLRLGRDAAKAQ